MLQADRPGKNFFSPNTFGNKKGFLLGVFALLVSTVSMWAQGSTNFVVLQTGHDTPLVSGQESVSPEDFTLEELVFDFGFYTTEVVAPNSFLDSLTVTLQGDSGAAVLLTADASGVVWAPPSMGGISLADSDISWAVISPLQNAPISGQGVAYTLTLHIPSSITGSPILYFDLFDNQNQAMSFAWYTPPRLIPVPEPTVSSLLMIGLVGGFIIRRKKIHAVPKP